MTDFDRPARARLDVIRRLEDCLCFQVQPLNAPFSGLLSTYDASNLDDFTQFDSDELTIGWIDEETRTDHGVTISLESLMAAHHEGDKGSRSVWQVQDNNDETLELVFHAGGTWGDS